MWCPDVHTGEIYTYIKQNKIKVCVVLHRIGTNVTLLLLHQAWWLGGTELYAQADVHWS